MLFNAFFAGYFYWVEGLITVEEETLAELPAVGRDELIGSEIGLEFHPLDMWQITISGEGG